MRWFPFRSCRGTRVVLVMFLVLPGIFLYVGTMRNMSKSKAVYTRLLSSDQAEQERYKTSHGNVVVGTDFAAEVSKRLNPHGIIIIPAVIDKGYLSMARNFYESIHRLELTNNTLFLGVHNESVEKAQRLGLPAFLYKDMSEASGYFNSKTFIQKAMAKHYMINDIINMGHSVLLTDLDMYWFKSPVEDVVKVCGDCDFVIQSEAKVQLNIGFMLVRPTKRAIAFYKKVIKMANSGTNVGAQAMFNKLVKRESRNIKYKVLNSNEYPDGLTYFERSKRVFLNQNPCTECYICHNNWIVGAAAKIFRFREHQMWHIEDNDGYYSNPEQMYLVYENVITNSSKNLHEIEMAALKDALAIAKILNRILILPTRFHHATGKETPLNGVLLIEEFDKHFAGAYRESTFITHPMVPYQIPRSECGGYLIDNNFVSANPEAKPNDLSPENVFTPLDMENGATEKEIESWFTKWPMGICQVLRVHGAYSAFKSFEEEATQRNFDDIIESSFQSGAYRQLELLSRKRKPKVTPTTKPTERVQTKEEKPLIKTRAEPGCFPTVSMPDKVDESQFTVVIPTMNRTTTLTKLLTHYLSMSMVAKVILVWFKWTGDVPKPETLVNGTLASKLMVKQITEDNILLRFQAQPEIETQGVFSVDDDLIVYEGDLKNAFNIWKKHPQALVGYFMRLHEQLKNGSYRYIWNPTKEYSMILTNAAFYHRAWQTLLPTLLPKSIQDNVKSWINCEDIALNFLISSQCSEGKFYVKPKQKPNHFSKFAASISGRKGHTARRDQCVDDFATYYDKMPLTVLRA